MKKVFILKISDGIDSYILDVYDSKDKAIKEKTNKEKLIKCNDLYLLENYYIEEYEVK